VLNDGIPPESYNWYLYTLDEFGEINSGPETLSDTHSNVVIIGNTLYYKLTKNIDEIIVIKAKGVLEGKVAKVAGQDFVCQTKPIMIYPKSEDSLNSYPDDIVDSTRATNIKYAARTDTTICDLIIDGVYLLSGNLPLVYWNAVNGVDTYLVEVTNENGKVLLLNSTDYAGFGDNHCILPSDFVTLKDKFSVRVKQKGGQYTPSYYYGYDKGASDDPKFYFDTIKESHYSYLKAFTDIIDNGYIRSIKELGAVLDYIILFEPGISTNSLITVTYGVSVVVGDQVETYDRKYAFKVYLELDFDDYASYYPININTDALDPIYVNLYKSLQAAQNAYCETGDMRVNMEYDIVDGGYYIYLYKNLNTQRLIPPEVPGIESLVVTEHYAKIPYGKNNGNYAINNKTARNAWTTDQLYNIAEEGKQPIPQTDVASNVYNAAKSVVNQIIGKDMTDLEKVLAFYDWLILNVEYDYEVLKTINDSNEQAYKHEAFHLEGVFLSYKAVCDGLAKAMSLLCRIEDIPCYKISGYVFNGVGGAGHAWSKIFIDGDWYVVDATWGGTTLNDSINYKYFMMTDGEFSSYYRFENSLPIIYGEFERATSYFNYYANTFINGYDTYINSIDELVTLLNSFGDTIEEDITVQVRISDALLLEYSLSQILGYAKAGITGNKTIADKAQASNDNTVMVITLEPTN
jgi:transglutaminase-like putative cysteine protease